MAGLFVPASRRPSVFRLLTAATLSALLSAGALHGASRPAVRAAEAMVVSPESHATRVGVETLRAGGNAVDAAVAVALTLAVTYPVAGNLGGGGFLLYRPPEGEAQALDFRETAPRRLEPQRFLDEDGRPIPGLSLRGGLAVGVPGSVAGLAEAHRLWGGRLDWATLLAPAIALAEDGFPISDVQAEQFDRHHATLLGDPEARRIFTREGRALRAGERLVQPDLASTLRAIAEHGPRGFYRGAVAAAIVSTVTREGGVLDRKDLARYRPVRRRPVEGSYRGYTIISFPPPSSGGLVLLQILGILEHFDLRGAGPGSSQALHWMAEAERRAYADRSRWFGDPDFFDVPAAGLLAADYLKARAATIRPDAATPSSRILPGRPAGAESPDTLHFSVADARGGAVALTTTLNTSFGTGIVAGSTGVLLNNEIDDFALAPGVPNTYGLLGGEANAVAGGKRPLSSMTPTIVEFPGRRERPALVLGSPGGSRIITSVLQVLVNVIDHRMPLQEAVDAGRCHHQWQPDHIHYEARALPRDVLQALIDRGHTLVESPDPMGNVSAIGVDDGGAWLGAPDPRRAGSAEGF